MGNILDFCVNRNCDIFDDNGKPEGKHYVSCSICHEKYVPDIIMPSICFDCKMGEPYEYQTHSLLTDKHTPIYYPNVKDGSGCNLI